MAYNILKHITFKMHLERLRAQFIEKILEFDFLIYSTGLLV